MSQCLLIKVLQIVTIAGTYVIGKHMPSAQKLWNEATSDRVAKTSKMMSQIKAVKMTGLEDVMSDYIQSLREEEIEHSKKTRTWLMRNYVLGTYNRSCVYLKDFANT